MSTGRGRTGGRHGIGRAISVALHKVGCKLTANYAGVPQNVLDKIVARIPVGRLGHPDEIARGVLFLVSDGAGFPTGSTMSIEGGQHIY
jgi:acetoacetyl-CoA reductase